MRLRSFFPMLFPVLLAGCGSMFDWPPADMSVAPTPAELADARHHHHGGHHGQSGIAYADDAPMPMPPGALDPSGGGRGASGGEDNAPGSVSFGSGGGQGQSVDITPHPATPDTEVSYGRNGHS